MDNRQQILCTVASQLDYGTQCCYDWTDGSIEPVSLFCNDCECRAPFWSAKQDFLILAEVRSAYAKLCNANRTVIKDNIKMSDPSLPRFPPCSSQLQRCYALKRYVRDEVRGSKRLVEAWRLSYFLFLSF
jgi:hypothetical protein